MNIFVLDPSPIISARMHCDQHLHKMILESAQMLSTACADFVPRAFKDSIYKPAYAHHPCTKWVSESVANMWWLVMLAQELEAIRQELEHSYHSSSKVIDTIAKCLPPASTFFPSKPNNFVFAGPAFIKLRADWPIEKKYQEYYKYKARIWALTEATRMSYKNRPVPDFLKDNPHVKSN